MKRYFKKLLAALLLCFGFYLSSSVDSADDETKVCLTDKGKALFPIVIAKTASDMTKSNAATFASYLQKITGATFAIEEGDGAKGIAFGR